MFAGSQYCWLGSQVAVSVFRLATGPWTFPFRKVIHDIVMLRILIDLRRANERAK